jgi:hypothetical protein
VVNDGDLTQSRATFAEASNQMPQTAPMSAIDELYLRVLKPYLVSGTGGHAGGHLEKLDTDTQIRKNFDDLNNLNRLITADHSRLVLMFIPFKKDVPEPGEEASEAFRKWSQSNSVTMLDLTYAENPYSSNEITLDRGIHLNAKGHSIVARAMEAEWSKWATGATERRQ